MAHGHTHDEHDAPPVRRALLAAVAVVAVLAAVALVVWWPRGEAPELFAGGNPFTYEDATVTAVRVEDCPGVEAGGAITECQVVAAELTSGADAGMPVAFRTFATDFSKPTLAPGDEVVLVANPAAPAEFRYTFYDFQRTTPLAVLLVLFVVAVVALGRWQGLRALAGIGVSLLVVLAFLLPSLLRGNPALPVALAATVAIAFVALYLAHGVSTATTVALVGTLVSLVLVAVLAQVFVGAASLTGLASAEAQVLRVTADAIDLQGLLVAGIVVGALGVLDDVTVTQVSTVAELRRADPTRSWYELYRSGLRVGRDHIASTVNTLVLAYAGASLPVLLLFLQGDQPWLRVGAGELVAIEIVRTLVGSIGLVVAVPVTTALAAVALSPRPAATASATST